MSPDQFFEEMIVLMPLMKNVLIPQSVENTDLLPQHYEILGLLALGGPRRMNELSRILGIAAPNLTFLVNRLADRGMVERVPDLTDKRAVRLEIRKNGMEELSKARKRVMAQFGHTLEGFNEEEKNELDTAVQTLRKLFFRVFEGS